MIIHVFKKQNNSPPKPVDKIGILWYILLQQQGGRTLSTEATTPATTDQREAIGHALLTRILPADLTEAEAATLLKRLDEVVTAATPFVQQIIRPATEPATTLSIEVVAEFTLGGVLHDAVRVHQPNEELVLGEEAIRRADTDRPDAKVVRSEEEWQFAYADRGELPTELNDFWLATARPRPGGPGYVSSLNRASHEWYENWDALEYGWSRVALVLRRRT